MSLTTKVLIALVDLDAVRVREQGVSEVFPVHVDYLLSAVLARSSRKPAASRSETCSARTIPS